MNFRILYDGDEIVITLGISSMYGKGDHLLCSIAHYIFLNANQDTIKDNISSGQRIVSGEINNNKLIYLGLKINDLSIL